MSSLSELMARPRIALSFSAGSPAGIGEEEAGPAVRDSLIALARPYGESSSSIKECRSRLEAEGIRFDGSGKAHAAQRVTPEKAGSLDWQEAVGFLESLPEGSWVSYSDIGRAAGTGARPAANWLKAEWERRVRAGEPHIKNQHRVLTASGELENSWLPDDQALSLSLSVDPESIVVSGLDEPTSEEGTLTWGGSAELSCKLPLDWSHYVAQIGAEQVAQALGAKFGEDAVRARLEDQIAYVSSCLTREADLAAAPLAWIRFSKA